MRSLLRRRCWLHRGIKLCRLLLLRGLLTCFLSFGMRTLLIVCCDHSTFCFVICVGGPIEGSISSLFSFSDKCSHLCALLGNSHLELLKVL